MNKKESKRLDLAVKFLKLIGIKAISSLDRDTYRDKEQFFSYRRACHQNEPDYGRLLSAIALR